MSDLNGTKQFALGRADWQLALLPMQQDDPWTVKLLPKVHWGAHPAGLDNLYPDDPRIAVMHHYLGSWKVGT